MVLGCNFYKSKLGFLNYELYVLATRYEFYK